MSRTGNKAFTLLEVMAASVALALGTVLIYQAFFICLDTFNFYADYLNISGWADNAVWQAQDKVRQGLSPGYENGEFTQNNRTFKWAMGCNLVDETTGLYSIDLSVLWKTGGRESVLFRNTYEILREK